MKMEQKIFDHFLRVKSVSTDTRKIIKDSIFFCLKGVNFNGNEFANKALELGASLVVADEEIEIKDERIICVKSALDSLQILARDYRRTFSIPFLAITGSNGKTTTKELMREVMSQKFKVHATQGNLNNHIGVPLTLLATPTECEFAIIEMGANHQGEIRSYCQYAEPNFGLITNLGKAHLEGFGGIEGVKKGKKELFDYLHSQKRKIFVNTELENLREISEGMERILYGFETSDFQLKLISESPSVVYSATSKEFSADVKTQLVGAYNMYNIASAVAVGRYFGVEDEKIHTAISAYQPENNRSQLLKTNSNTLIMDAYNANPSSMEHALINLSKQEAQNKYFVIGDMRELGEESIEEHRSILEKATELGLEGITVGHYFKLIEGEFGFPSFADNVGMKNYLEQKCLKNHLILIKGSRGIKLEEVVSTL